MIRAGAASSDRLVGRVRQDARVRTRLGLLLSGGLLVAVPEERAGEAPGVEVGRVNEGEPGAIAVR